MAYRQHDVAFSREAADRAVVPSRGQLTILCEQARADGTLHDLREQLAALFSVGERFGVVYSELVSGVAASRLDRDLAQRAQWRGYGAKSRSADFRIVIA
jgi:hypothetical protein